MSEPNKDGTDIMMALLIGLSGPRASKAWNESQQIKAESFLTMAEHWINQTAEENARLKAEVERLTKAGNQFIAVGMKLREMVGDHHWSLEFDRVRTDWHHASRDFTAR
jgi:hypothetical protein